MKNYIFAVACIASLLMLVGCESLTQGNKQTITFHLEPSTAQCVASQDNVDVSSFSAGYNTVSVTRQRGDLVALCTAPGYQRQVTRVKSATQAGGVIGGFFLDYGVTDIATGAMWRYPDDVTIVLTKL